MYVFHDSLYKSQLVLKLLYLINLVTLIVSFLKQILKQLFLSLDCADTHSSCKYWKSKDFCSTSKGFPHVITVCPLSCARCVLCPTQEPNTALPPTEEEEKSRVLGNFTINAA